MSIGHDRRVQEKQELRRAIREARSARIGGASFIAAAAQADLIRADVVTGYLATPGEPDPTDVFDAVRGVGGTVLLPRVHGKDLVWVPWTTDVAPGPFGLREPIGPAVAADVVASSAVMFLPALAVDTQGKRLGQGGGFFDRLLAHLPRHNAGGPLRVAVLFDEEFIGDVPGQQHDQPVDAVLTPTRCVWI